MSQITIGLLTSPLPFIAIGALGGALAATIAGAFAAEIVGRRSDRADNITNAAAARLANGLRRVIHDIDQGKSLQDVRAVAAEYLAEPRVLKLPVNRRPAEVA
ncbi:hypothetical protein [Ancylobacter sp. IITR112]|uniref:hypothetical protein n=1 Tax=Ancylobacter sp. IITR112 TaxID=3138073 RepID=UPI00352B7E20